MKHQAERGIVAITVILLIVIALTVLGAAFYFRYSTSKKPTSTRVPTATKEATKSGSLAASASSSASTGEINSYTSKQVKDLSFKPFTITYPADWTVVSKLDDPENGGTFAVQKGEYKLSISQSLKYSEGTFCAFDDDDLKFDDPNAYPPLNAHGVNYRQIKSPVGIFRLIPQDSFVTDEAGASLTACLKEGGQKYFAIPTIVGVVTYTIPKAPEELMLKQLDAILGTIIFAN